jgi:sialate O-acetylesterase
MYGLKDYNGFAWYRKRFNLDQEYKGKQLILLLGKIDDVDEVYLNGMYIGKTGDIGDNPDDIHLHDQDWQTQRAYAIPKEILKAGGENLIAVRVYDGNVNGGIYEGPIGITTRERFQDWQKKTKSFLDFIFDLW